MAQHQVNYLRPAAWLVNDRAFVSLYDAQEYQRMFRHHTIEPLFRNV